jgi:VanZ family protein
MISFFLNLRQPIRIFLVIIYVGCIAALSLLPMSDFPQIPEFRGFDKVVHFSMYFIFSGLFCWALKAELNYLWLLLIVPVTVGWGIFMEFMQLEMHLGRSFDVHDMIANSIGVVVGILFYLLLACKYSKSKQH